MDVKMECSNCGAVWVEIYPETHHMYGRCPALVNSCGTTGVVIEEEEWPEPGWA